MISHQPHVNKLVYLLQTKLQCELPQDILNDINYTLYDYGRECVKVDQREKEYWKSKTLKQ